MAGRGGVLIIGGGEAGLAVATELRELGYPGRVTIVGDEQHPPYHRPPLSKGFLAGTEDEEAVELRAPVFLAERGITVVTDRRVESLDVDVDGDGDGGAATLDDGSTLGFDSVVLATGASARMLPVTGTELRGVHVLRTIDHALALRGVLDPAVPMVVIGGGFVGLEVAATARAAGMAVTVVEAAGRLLERVCAPPLSERCLRAHRDAGVDVLLETGVTEILGDDVVHGVLLSDGTTLPAGVVVVGVGAVPQISLAEKLGLDCRRGIVVDASGRTAHPRVFAVGDCTEQPHPHLDGELVALESVNNAVEQGKAAAHALLGLEPPARGVPWFWSDQGAMKIQIAGVSHGYDDYVVRSADGRLTVLYYRAGRLIAGDAVDNPRDFQAVRRALAEGKTVDRARAEDLSLPLKRLVLA